MESENGIAVEGSNQDVNKENESKPFSGGNGILKSEKTDKQGLARTKISNQSKDPNAKSSRLSISRIEAVFGRSSKASLTQSVSFPGRGRHADLMKRSIEVYPTKSDVRQSQKNSWRVESQVCNGSLSCGRTINPVGKKPFPGVNSGGRRSSAPTLIENQDEEIKLHRKSLAFKATPMPSFYKEPPPRVELKKIATTRAVSPKLGRNKDGASCVSPRVSRDSSDCKSNAAAFNKSGKSSLSKTRTHQERKEETEGGCGKDVSCSNGSIPAQVTVEG